MFVHLVIALCDADGLESPYLIEIAPLDVVVDRLCGVVGISCNLGAGIRDIESGTIRQSVLQHVAPADLELPSRGAEVGVVGHGHASSENGRQFGCVAHHVECVAHIEVECGCESVIECSDIKTDIIAFHFLPCQECGNETWCVGDIGFHSILQPCARHRVVGDGLVGLIPIVDVLVSERTVGCSQFEGVDFSHKVLPELLACDVPSY